MSLFAGSEGYASSCQTLFSVLELPEGTRTPALKARSFHGGVFYYRPHRGVTKNSKISLFGTNPPGVSVQLPHLVAG